MTWTPSLETPGGRTLVFAVFLACMVSVDCGTIVTRTAKTSHPLAGPPRTIPAVRAYSGVWYDLTRAGFFFPILDVPLSLVADTVLLPYDLGVAALVPRRLSEPARDRLAAMDGRKFRLGDASPLLRLGYRRDDDQATVTIDGTVRQFTIRLRHDLDADVFAAAMRPEARQWWFEIPRSSPECAADLDRLRDAVGGR